MNEVKQEIEKYSKDSLQHADSLSLSLQDLQTA